MGPVERAATLPAGEPAPDEVAFGSRIGRYLVLNVLGRGGMGVVYEAYDPVLDRRIAVKRLREATDDGASEGRTRMQREAQALARLSHPNVITVHDVSEYAGAMYIAMELVQGKTLRDWQVGRGWREVLAAYCAAARGLGAAHAAGLVHRDFKPENVLVGDDGRVRVTDFGLARLTGAAPEAPVAGSPGTFAEQLTAAGTVMGTPSYMAPEQIDGEPVDERTDQFAWCIAAWEAIYCAQPFITGNLAVRSAAMKTDTPRPPASTRVPRSIARVLLRGLLPEPARRWPTMQALLGELERATTSRTAAIAVTGLVAVGVVAAVFAVGRHSGEAALTCSAAGAPVGELWTPAVERELGRAFMATGAPFASDALAALGRAATAWRARWQRIATESCEATRIQGIQTPATLDLRTACLLRARDRLGGVLAGLARPERKTVEAAASLALPDLDACSDVAALAGALPPPRDPVVRTAIEGQLDRLEQALEHSPKIERVKQLVPEVEAELDAAGKLGWVPLVARARRLRARLSFELGNGKSARSTLVAAAGDAAAANDPDLLVEIYTELAEVEARLTSEFALGESWIKLASGTLSHLGPRPKKQLEVAHVRGLVAQRAGRPDEAHDAYTAALAIARTLGPLEELGELIDLGLLDSERGDLVTARGYLERALELARRELGDKHPRIATIQHDLGTVAFRQGNYAEAERLFRAALALRMAAYGDDDVNVALTFEAIGNTLVLQDRVDEARASFQRAISLLEARLGPDHPDVASAYNDIGATYHRAGLYELALANSQRVLAMREKALGPDHPDVAQSLVNLAIEAKNLERWDLIEPSYQRALAIFDRAFGPGSFEVGITYLNLGEARRARGALDAAGEAYDHGRRVLSAKLGADHPLLAHIWNGLGQLELARGHLDAARPLLERAVAVRVREGGDATDVAESRFALAIAIAATDRARAGTLATQARDVYRTAGKGYAKRLAAVEAWLAARP